MIKSQDVSGVAIIGMACRFPGADNPAAFWHNLCEGVESVTFFSDDDLLAAGVEPSVLQNPSYIKAAPILNDVDKFDTAFFAFSPKEAILMDPQQRFFLEVGWEAFEDAGYHPPAYEGKVGVYAGSGGVMTSYLMKHQGHAALSSDTAGVPHIGNDKDFLSTRVSYKLNLTGPSVTIQTACSTSLVAVHLACQSLLSGECDMALAGASTIRVPHLSGYWVEKGNIYSMDGHCRAFDAAGQGTIFGSGVAAVLLKNLEDAVADRDPIYAVIKGTAINNDGGIKVSYAAPSADGQTRAMTEALSRAEVLPDTIGYVECHATGTRVGDPEEIQALTQTFRTQTTKTQFCAIGSVKTNIGHPEQTAGLAGLIKTALSLKHQRIPPSLHFVTPNPAIDFAQSPFYVNTTLRDWPAGPNPRRAAVNSLGIGGTNAFAVLEEPPDAEPMPSDVDRQMHLCCLSAKNESALRAQADRLRVFLEGNPEVSCADVCYTANVSRSAFSHRFAIMADTVKDLEQKLEIFAAEMSGKQGWSQHAKAQPVVFLFPGQGAQYQGMAMQLYHTQATFREALDECNTLFSSYLDIALLDVLFASEDNTASRLHDTAYTQPALFAVEYALAQLWQAWGVVPDALIGHSIGELVAACVADVFTLADAIQLVAHRGRLMQGLPKQGVMAVVFAPESVVHDALAPYADRASIAAVNSPQNTVISGVREAITLILEGLKAKNIASTPLNVSHAFHSPLMDPMLDPFEDVASRILTQVPRIPLISNLSGQPLDQAPGSRYWRDHIRQPVRFADGMQTLHALGYALFLEVGPGGGLLGMGRQCLPQADATWLSSLKPPQDWQSLLESLQKLYLAGFSINWQMIDQGCHRRRISLPTYPFQRQSYWLEPSTSENTRVPSAVTSGTPTADTHPLLGTQLRSALKETQFESRYSLEDLPYLAEHQIHGRIIVPTTAGLETVLAAGQTYFGGCHPTIERLMYHDAFVLPAEGACLVQTILTPQGADRAAFQWLSSDISGNDAWRTHLSGVVYRTTAQVAVDDPKPFFFSMHERQTRCPRVIAAEHFYRAVRTQGLVYGPSFQGIQQLWCGDGEVVSYVQLPTQVAPDPYGLHPAFLDACLQTYLGLTRGYGNPSLAYLPLSIRRFRVYQQHITEAWCHAILHDPPADDDALVLDIRLYDTTGDLVAILDGVSVRQIPPTAFRPTAATTFIEWLYHIRWDDRPPATGPHTARAEATTSWLVFADKRGLGAKLAERIEQRGDACFLVSMAPTFTHNASGHWTINASRPEHFHRLLREVSATGPVPCQRVVYLWGLDMPSITSMTLEQLERAEAEGMGGALFLTQALAAARATSGFTPRLWLITQNAQKPNLSAPPLEVAQAPLWGFGRTVQLEHPLMWGGLIDIGPMLPDTERSAAEALLAELLHTDGENQVALRDNKRFVARFVRLPESTSSQADLRFRADATYLITGGLGMLGLKIAQWLVERQGVRYVVLTSRRRAQGAAAQEVIAACESVGAQVRIIQADVAVEAEVQRLMEEVRQNLPPLKGVMHGAGVLEDGILSQLAWPSFARVTAPKIKGGWLLHQYTQHMELDFFILLSSVLSLIGSAGQANYTAGNAFLDGLAGYRRTLGLPATAINFGPWDDAGMAMASGTRGAAIWRARGMQYIAAEDGLRVFEHVLHHQIEHAAVTLTDWTVYLEQLPARAPIYAELAHEAASRDPQQRGETEQEVQTQLRQASPQDQRDLLRDVIRHKIMEELGFEETIDTRQPLNELGLDSLMSVNIINRLEATLGISIPVVQLIKGPSIEQFVDDLLPELAGLTEPLTQVETVVSEEMAPPTITTPVAEIESLDHPTSPDQTVPPPALFSTVTPPLREVVSTSKTAGNGWLVFHRPNAAARMRLFCFPFAGGGASLCRTWVNGLHPSIEVIGVEPPGRAARIHEPPLNTITDFLDALVPVMLPYLDKPFAFYGHCLGGLTMFETARALLEDHRLRVEHLIVSGSRPPHRVKQLGFFEETMLADILTHEKFDPFLPAYEQPDEVFIDILRHFRLDATEEFLQLPELRNLLLPTIRAEFTMASNYRCVVEAPWDIPITCFTGLDDTYVTRKDAMAWSQFTKSTFTLHMREGTHFLIVDDRDFILDTINRVLSA